MALHLLLLPVVVAVSYEINRFVGRHDNWFTRIITAPGMWLQNFTTNEPDDSMIEVGIESLKLVIPNERVQTSGEKVFRFISGCQKGVVGQRRRERGAGGAAAPLPRVGQDAGTDAAGSGSCMPLRRLRRGFQQMWARYQAGGAIGIYFGRMGILPE